MDREASRRLEQSSLTLLAEAAPRLGFTATIASTRLLIRDRHGRSIVLAWPSKVIPKSKIASLLTGTRAVHGVPTLRFRDDEEPPYLPGCAKPDRASGGRDFVVFRNRAQWRERKRQLDRRFVVQPLLEGDEYRVTVCRSGVFAAAQLVSRRGRGTAAQVRWRDAPRFPSRVVRDLHSIVETMGMPGIGFDVMECDDKVYVLDVNLFPSLAIHAEGEPPRDIAEPFLADWIALATS